MRGDGSMRSFHVHRILLLAIFRCFANGMAHGSMSIMMFSCLYHIGTFEGFCLARIDE